jgi:hypothetical protein
MNRKNFISILLAGGAFASYGKSNSFFDLARTRRVNDLTNNAELNADVVIAGGGLGGCAAAMAALRNNLSVILTEETDWIGGQLTQQGVPPDENPWVETYGCTKLYAEFRNAVRNYYFRNYPLTDTSKANKLLNPGDGYVSRLCHEPRVALAVLYEMFAPHISSGKLTLLLNHKITDARVSGDQVKALQALNLYSGNKIILTAPYFIDATELGDLLPLTGTEFITGTESQKETRELHAPEKGDPENNQAFTVCFAMDFDPEKDHTIEKPSEYDFWRSYKPQMEPAWTGRLLDFTYPTPSSLKPQRLDFNPEGISTAPLLNLWNYRRIINKNNFQKDFYNSDVTIVNWPQNDYLLGNLIGVSDKEFQMHVNRAKQLSLSLLYWLQTEAPRPGGGYGWPGIRLRKDILGTEDGLAKFPYIRESRRIKALFTVLEEHVGKENRKLVSGEKTSNKAFDYYDSVGIGSYNIDLHPSIKGKNYIDIPSLPFQIPLGALLPVRMKNLLPANKNIGTTHITNGCYRLHPVEWNIGESTGMLVSFSINKKILPREVREKEAWLEEFTSFIRSQGIRTHWPAE